MKPFPCIGCGACCRYIPLFVQHKYSVSWKSRSTEYPKDSPEYQELIKAGLSFNDDGSCAHLVGDKCSIYETRPSICRVDEQAKTKHLVQTPRDMWKHHLMVAEACNTLLKHEGRMETVEVEPLSEYELPSVVQAGKKIHYTRDGMITLCGYVVKGSWGKRPYEEPAPNTCRACAGLLK